MPRAIRRGKKGFGSQTTCVKVVCLLSYADRYNAFFFQNLVLPLFFLGQFLPLLSTRTLAGLFFGRP